MLYFIYKTETTRLNQRLYFLFKLQTSDKLTTNNYFQIQTLFEVSFLLLRIETINTTSLPKIYML